MKKGAETIITVGLLVIAGFLGFVTFESNVVKAASYNVGSGLGNDTTSIQDAIDNFASDGDTVFVWGGTYYENVIVNKTITLIGEDRDLAIIHGNTNLDVVRVESDWVNVTGFTITNGTSGIYVNTSNNVRIEDNNISYNFQYGIYITSSSHNDITGNNVTFNNEDGIHLVDSTYNNIIDNNVIENDRDGIYLDASTNNNITNNFLLYNQDDGINLYIGSNQNNISYNNASSTSDDGIFLYTASNNTIAHNEVWNNSDGIFLYMSSQDNTVTDNDANSNRVNGIYIQWSNNNNITNNEIYSNRNDGIYLTWGSSSNTIQNNNVTDNINGINLNGADGTMIFNNNISYNTDYGVYIGSSSDLIVTGNTMIEDGIFIFSNSFADWNSHTIDTSNTANGKPVYYLKDQTGGVVPIGAGQVILVNCTGVLVFGQEVDNCSVGMELGYSNDNIIINNNEANNIYGFYLYLSDGNTISDNVVDNNRERGIYIGFGNNNEIIDNNATGNNLGIFIRGGMGNNVTGNNASDNQEGLYLDSTDWNNITGNIFFSNDDYGIDLLTSVNNAISYNDLINNTDGIYLESSHVNTITGNNVTYSQRGIYLETSSGNIITGNNASYNIEAGIAIYSSISNNLTDNTMINDGIFIRGDSIDFWNTHYIDSTNTVNGRPVYYMKNQTGVVVPSPAGQIILANCSNIGITDRDFTNTSVGIELGFSSDINVSGNELSYNYYGIYLEYSDWNNVTVNNITTNYWGLWLVDSSFNNIYHNSIINNINQSYDDSIGLNQWDDGYPSGGNYWSDWSPITPDMYSGATTPQITGSPDGICDTQYDIDVDSVDYYPLKGPWDPTTTPPSAPVLFAEDGVTYVNLTWNLPSDGGLPISNYRIYRGLASNMEVFLTEIDSVLFYNDTAVNGGTTYFYNVSAVNIRGEGPLSNEDNGTPLAPPGPPIGFLLSSGNSYVNLSWFAPGSDGGSAVIRYNIYRNGTPGVYDFVPAGQLWFNDTDVTNGLTYTYNITAVNGIGESLKTSDESATPMTLPSAPENLQADAGDSYVGLLWVMPQDDGGSTISGYNIYRNGTAGVYDTAGTAQAWYVDSNVTNGITYTYNITAVNSVGEGPAAMISATPMTVPSAPENPQASAGDGIVQITWDAPLDDGGSAITGYNIYRSDEVGVYATVPAGQLSYNDMNVVNGVTYNYIISANNSVGEGQKTVNVNDVPMGVPSAPQNLDAVAGDGYVNLTWDAPSDNGGSAITWYNIYRDGTPGVYDTVPAGQLWFYDDSVTNGVEYTYNVAAVNTIGEGPDTSDSATPMTVPSAPQNLLATAEDGHVVLTWSTPADDGGSTITEYHIYRDGTVTIFQTVTATGLSYEDHDVTNGVTYTYDVSASNIVGEGALSNEANAKAGSGPAVPSNFTATAGDSYAYLTWDIPASNGSYSITNYTIYRGTSSGSETFLVILGNVLSYNDTTVVNDVTYYYRISATNGIAEGTLSNSVSATPQAPAIPINEPPTSTITSPSEGDSLEGTLNISGSSSDADSTIQTVEIRIDDENWITVSGTTSWTHSLDTTQLSDGEHTITVRSYDGENYSAETSISVTVTNPEEEEEAEPESPLLWIIIIIIVIVLVLVLLLATRKKKPAEEEELVTTREKEAGEKPSEAPPPPPPWMEEKGDEPPEEEIMEEKVPEDETTEEGFGEEEPAEEEQEKESQEEPGEPKEEKDDPAM